MTAEEKREQQLKRILPGLAITVLYFVFASGMISEKMKKAETEYKNLISSGVSKDALPGVMIQQQQSQQQLIKLQESVTKLQAQMKTLAGFLANSGNSTNATMAKVTGILDDYQIKQSKDQKAAFPQEQLSPALKEVWQSIKPPEVPSAPKPTATNAALIAVHHLWLKGSYTAMYKALSAIADSDLQILPITLTMQMPETGTEDSDEQEWELILWM